MNVAFVMEQTLGSVTHYLNLRREESQATGIVPRWLPIEYREGLLPWALGGSLLARKAVRGLQVDGLFVHTTTLALQLGRSDAIISTDGTPLNKRGMREWYGLRPEGGLAERIKTSVYKRAFRGARGFVAWSTDAKRSLVDEYGCPADAVAVIPPGIDLGDFAPGTRDHELPRILFVGGDFPRKGGDLLLEVFRKRLRGKAELELVTPAEVAPEPGVRVHRGLKANSPELRRLYAESDVFVLPTRADCYPLVCMEALAAGLPLVATAVGGIPDMIRENETGHCVQRDDAGALGDALESLCLDRPRRERMSILAREDAARRFEVRTNARRLFDYVRERLA